MKQQKLWTKTAKIISLILIFAFLTATAAAHDYWFEADNFFPPENGSVTIHLLLGTKLAVEEERAYQRKRTVFFSLFSIKNILDLRAKSVDGTLPIIKFDVGKSGTYLLGMERDPVGIVLEAEKFNDYLREEGLTKVIAERARLGENAKFGYERYSRYIKSLIEVGNRKDATYKKLLGFKLEIQPLENPSARKVGDSLKLKVLFEGKPLADSEVFAYNRAAGKVFIQAARTKSDGTFSIKLDRSGFWLVRLVQMRRCLQDCEETDWESFWGALSFAVR